MPAEGFKSITVPEAVWEKAKRLVDMGLERSIPKVVTNAIEEYYKRREDIIQQLIEIKNKWNKPTGD